MATLVLTRSWLAVLGSAVLAIGTLVTDSPRERSLPSAIHGRDDVQYFPAGPAFKLERLCEEIEEYKLQQLGLDGPME